MMEFFARAIGRPTKLAILPGAFNPPTLAHLAVAHAALTVADEVLFVLPRAFPHKEYSDGGFDERLELLRAAIEGAPRFSLAASDHGLFVDIAREAARSYSAELFLLCGRDAAERIVGWDYGEADSIRQQLEEFQLLVASRAGAYQPPPEIRERVLSLTLPRGLEDVSSTEVRRRIRAGERWEELVSAPVAALLASRIDRWRGGRS